MTRRALLALGVSVFALACGRHLTFEHLARADRLEVRRRNTILFASEDRDTISKARTFILARSDGWDKDWAGTPIPVFTVYFLSAGQVLGGYGVGPDFLTTDPGPGFLSRSIRGTEAAEIASVLGVSLERR